MPQRAFRLAVLSAVVVAAGLMGVSQAWATTGGGWVRLAHFSPNTPAVDVYLYSFGNPQARLVLHHVSYGECSPYEQLPTGDYTVAMRLAGAKPSTKPVLSTEVAVSTGNSYTVAGMGPANGLRLQVLQDTSAVPPGHALVRVIQASLRQHVVAVNLGGRTLARALDFGSATSYRSVRAGTAVARVTGGGADATASVALHADTVQTLVVLDGKSGLQVTDLADAAGSQVQPSGGADTGFGGTAPRPASSPLPWAVVLAAGGLLTVAVTRSYHRKRPAHARTR
jgi:hypothetical protein